MTTVAEGERGRTLLGSRCSSCGYVSFPAKAVCPKCGPFHAAEVKPFQLPESGTVVTWTQLKVAPKGFPSPLLHCILDLGSVKIAGTVQGCSELKEGEKLIIVEDRSGTFPYAFARP